jgi:hypothetical protein
MIQIYKKYALGHNFGVAHVEGILLQGAASLSHGSSAESGHQLGQRVGLDLLSLLALVQFRILEGLLC